MRRVRAMLLAAATTVGAVAGDASSAAEQQSAGHPASASASPAARPAAFAALAARLPGFAAALSEMPTIVGPRAWRPIPYEKSWAALAGARPDTRQALRWDYARSLIAAERGDDAIGVLDVMRQDDPDLALVPSWQLARGAALAQTGRASEALAALDGARLAANPERRRTWRRHRASSVARRSSHHPCRGSPPPRPRIGATAPAGRPPRW